MGVAALCCFCLVYIVFSLDLMFTTCFSIKFLFLFSFLSLSSFYLIQSLSAETITIKVVFLSFNGQCLTKT